MNYYRKCFTVPLAGEYHYIGQRRGLTTAPCLPVKKSDLTLSCDSPASTAFSLSHVRSWPILWCWRSILSRLTCLLARFSHWHTTTVSMQQYSHAYDETNNHFMTYGVPLSLTSVCSVVTNHNLTPVKRVVITWAQHSSSGLGKTEYPGIAWPPAMARHHNKCHDWNVSRVCLSHISDENTLSISHEISTFQHSLEFVMPRCTRIIHSRPWRNVPLL